MHPLWKIVILIALLGAGTLLATLCITLVAMVQGLDLAQLMEMTLEGDGQLPTSLLRPMLWIQALAGFILPAVVYLTIFHGRSWKGYLGMTALPAAGVTLISIVLLFASLPLVQLAYEVNTMIPLPVWATTMQESAAEVMQDILRMESFGGFLITLLLVAVLPGIGEELVFRGILQNQVQEWTRNPVLSVWIAAMVFSGIHMQFEGFLPRLVLGAVLGYVYIWTKNLWIPILVHAVNNGFQVAVLYFSGVDLSDLEQEQSIPLNVWLILGSVVVLYLCYRFLTKPASVDET